MPTEKKIKKLHTSDISNNKITVDKAAAMKSGTTRKRKNTENRPEVSAKKKKQSKDNNEAETPEKNDKNVKPSECKIRKINVIKMNGKLKKVAQIKDSSCANEEKEKIEKVIKSKIKTSSAPAENHSVNNNKNAAKIKVPTVKKAKLEKELVKNTHVKKKKDLTVKKLKNENNSKIKEITGNTISSHSESIKKRKLVDKAQKKALALPDGKDKPLPLLAPMKPVDVNDPFALLMMMEGGKSLEITQPKNISPSVAGPSSSYGNIMQNSDDDEEEEDSEEMSEWEEVQNHTMFDEKSQIPDQPVEITLEMPDVLKHKRKKKTFDWKTYLNRRVKRFKKEVAMDMHKVHLLCLLSLGLQQNGCLDDPTLMAIALSILPSQLTLKAKAGLETHIENLNTFYKKKFPLDKINHCSDIKLIQTSYLITSISKGLISDARVWVLVFIVLLRSCGLAVRLILSLQPMPFKFTDNSDKNVKQKENEEKKKEKPKSVKNTFTTASTEKKTKPKAKKSQDPRRLSVRESGKMAAKKNKEAVELLSKDSDDEDEDGNETDEKSNQKPKSKSTKQNKLKNGTQNEDSRKILSPSASDEDGNKTKTGTLGHDFWLEIYFPQKKKWICFDCFKCQFGKPYSLENSATQPLSYVLGFKNDNSVKDVTARYAKLWLSQTRKFRIDENWWIQTLCMFDETSIEDNRLEDDDIKGHLLVRPMPQTIGEFKNHPLYALQRHLLKFEAIYPETSIPLGYIRKEPVYARECVRILHSRVNWLKEGRLVRLNEKPYKMVKSRPKWNKPKEDPDALDLELFGEWQTELYMAPPAFNGKVPKNDYGNVELFKPWMLPKGTVHIKGQGMQRVAKKLNIDIAPAMMGWEYHSRSCVPLLDGWVVCEEFADTLMTAWLEDQEIQQQREEEAIEKRVYGNWRRLIRGLLIKERLKRKFLMDDKLIMADEKKAETFSDGEEACDVQQSWPCNRQEQVSSKKLKVNVKSKVAKDPKPSKHTGDDKSKPDKGDASEDMKDEEELKHLVMGNIIIDKHEVISTSHPAQKRRKTNLKLNKGKTNLKELKAEETSSGESEDDSDRKFKGKGVFVSQKIETKVNKNNSGRQSSVGITKMKGRKSMQNRTKDAEEDVGSAKEQNKRETAPGRRPSIARTAKTNIKFVDESQDEESEGEGSQSPAY